MRFFIRLGCGGCLIVWHARHSGFVWARLLPLHKRQLNVFINSLSLSKSVTPQNGVCHGIKIAHAMHIPVQKYGLGMRLPVSVLIQLWAKCTLKRDRASRAKAAP